jgi:serine protease Do
VVIDPRGYILTNNHVVAEADELKVNFVDGKSVSAQVVGTDPKTDLAVVKVDPAAVADLKVARLGDSDRLQVGEWVIAIGNPFGLDHTVTVGVLSAKNRGIGAATYEDFLQTDASINPGNSGGPLVNLDGEVIGINTAIAGIGTGIGFAVPSTMARPIIDQLIASGKVKRPYLGIAMQDVTAELSKALGSRAPDKGAIVSQIQPGSPADKAGFKAGDVIVSVDGKAVDGSKSVQRAVLGKSIGQKVDVAVWREGKQLVIPTVTAPLPDDGKEAEGPRGGGQKQTTKSKLGLSLQPLSPEIAAELGVPKGTAGVVVGGVRDGGPAQEAGLRRGDVILGVDGQPVRSVDEAQRALVAPRPGGHIVRLQRGDAALFLTLPE